MRRRALLALGAGLLGGCLSAATPGTPTDATTPDRLPPAGDGTPLEFGADEPFARRTVGDRGDGAGHRIVVWNDDADRRPITVRLRAVGDADPAVAVTRTFPAYGSLRVGVFRPADYLLEVAARNGRGRTLGVRREFVDCDDSATHVAVRPDGTVRARVVATAAACDPDDPPDP